MTSGLTALKILVILLIIITNFNYFFVVLRVLISIFKKENIDLTLLKRSQQLLIFSFISVWISTILIFFLDNLFFGKTTEYSAITLYILGIQFLVVAIASAILSILSVLNNIENKYTWVLVFRKFFKICFVFTIILWSTMWTISSI